MRYIRRGIICFVAILMLAGCAPRTVDFGVVGGTRALAAPAAPVVSSVRSEVVNQVCVGECALGGAASWVTSDVLVWWEHEDPLAVDDYEVWQATMEPYFEPETCAACALVATSSGLQATIADSPPGFNPVGGTDDADFMSAIDFYVVRARNAGGTSGNSNRIGVVTFSLLAPAQLLSAP